MPPSAGLTHTYCDADDIIALLSVVGEETRLDDDGNGTVSAGELAYLSRIITWATARCNLYLLSKHSAEDLAASHIVNGWATAIGCYLLSCRRGNPPGATLKEMYESSIEDLKAVQRGEVTLPDTALRSAAWPAWSNIRIDWTSVRKARVQRNISEKRSRGEIDYDQPRAYPEEILGNGGPFG